MLYITPISTYQRNTVLNGNMMKLSPSLRFLLSAITLSVGLALACSSASAQLKWETTEIEQKLKLGEENGEATFSFQNTGTYPVTIRSTSTSCGCTTAALARKTYYPGEKGEIVVRFAVGGRNGIRQNSVEVRTDDPVHPSSRLVYTADIPTLIEMSPRLLRWSVGSEAEAKIIRLDLNPEADLKVIGIQTESKSFKIDLQPGEKPGEFQVEVTPLETKSPQRAIISLQTEPNLENRTHFSFYAYIR